MSQLLGMRERRAISRGNFKVSDPYAQLIIIHADTNSRLLTFLVYQETLDLARQGFVAQSS